MKVIRILYLLTLAFALSACTPVTAPTDPTTEAATQQASALTSDRGDGIYLVGVDMARGWWQSDGNAGGDCYYFSHHADGIILQQFSGDPAGHRLHLEAYDYEIEFDNCGTWRYLGPEIKE